MTLLATLITTMYDHRDLNIRVSLNRQISNIFDEINDEEGNTCDVCNEFIDQQIIPLINKQIIETNKKYKISKKTFGIIEDIVSNDENKNIDYLISNITSVNMSKYTCEGEENAINQGRYLDDTNDKKKANHHENGRDFGQVQPTNNREYIPPKKPKKKIINGAKQYFPPKKNTKS